MKKTAFNNIHRKMGGHMVEFGGFELPMQYTSIIKEHLAVRNGVGMFDVSHMGDLWIKGPDALELMQKLQPNDAASLKPGDMLYSHILDHDGHIKDDTIFGLYEEDKFFAVPNAATIDMIFNWYKKVAKDNNLDVEIENASDRLSCIALQGPKAPETLAKITDAPVEKMKSFKMITAQLDGVSGEAMVSTTGYTGEKGFEIIVENENAEALFNTLYEAGKEFDIRPCGLGARDTLRMEKGFLLSGQDFDEDQNKHTTIETGYKWIVKGDHDFIGKDVIESQIENGVSARFTGIILDDKGVPRHGSEVFAEDGEKIGVLTSGTMSLSLKKGIGLLYATWGYHKKGTPVEVDVRGKRLAGHIKRPPLV